jgi:hypothetical protein
MYLYAISPERFHIKHGIIASNIHNLVFSLLSSVGHSRALRKLTNPFTFLYARVTLKLSGKLTFLKFWHLTISIRIICASCGVTLTAGKDATIICYTKISMTIIWKHTVFIWGGGAGVGVSLYSNFEIIYTVHLTTAHLYFINKCTLI